MPMTLEQMTPDLLALNQEERGRAIDLLFESLDRPSGIWGAHDPRLAAELDRRVAEYEADPSTARPWEEVDSELRTMVQIA